MADAHFVLVDQRGQGRRPGTCATAPPVRRAQSRRSEPPAQSRLGLVLATDRRAPPRSNGSATSTANSRWKRCACLIGPDGIDKPTVPRRLAETALAREPAAPWCHYGSAWPTFALVDTRTRSPPRKVSGDRNWVAGCALNYPVLAMAHQRLGHRDEARRWLDKAHGRAHPRGRRRR